MARPLRIEFPGAVYHVTSRGNARADIFEDDNDRRLFLSILGQTAKRFNWLCHAYCLMGNHYHLLIETPEGNLSVGMRHLGRPAVTDIFSADKKIAKQERNRLVRHAYVAHGYTLKEIAQVLGVHYTTISKVINSEEN